MNALTTEITLRVNSTNLVRHLQFGFTEKATVLSELMQNAHRAGASCVRLDFEPDWKRLVVTDDGGGIDDLQTLLTVAESGWDAETVQREHPFGLGFLSAVHACERLEIQSKFGRIAFRTADLLAFKSIPVDLPTSPWDGATVILLHGIDLTHHHQGPLAEAEFQAKVERLARGFPIPVLVNGRELSRPHAIDGPRRFVETSVGRLSLSGVGEGEDWTKDYTTDLAVYLQGLPVYATPYRRNEDWVNVIHLDSTRFFARLPDRDKLIDEDQVICEIRQHVRAFWQQRLKALKATTPPEVFVQGYRAIRDWGALELLNDVPYVPGHLLFRITEYPRLSPSEAYDYTEVLQKPLPRSEIENGTVKLGRLNSPEETGDGFLRRMFAWKAGMLLIDEASTDLHPDHWVHPFVRDLDEEPLELEVLGSEKIQTYGGHWIWGVEVRFCQAYRLSLASETIECDGEAVYWAAEEAILMPAGESSGLVVRQIESFIDSDDRFCEGDAEEEQDLLRIFVLSNRTDSAVETLKALLPRLRLEEYPALRGKRLRITVDSAGAYRVETD
jgi:hypothetical protein